MERVFTTASLADFWWVTFWWVPFISLVSNFLKTGNECKVFVEHDLHPC